MAEVEMRIRGLMMDPVTNMPIVILKDLDDSMMLPIWVGVTKPTPSRSKSRRSPRRGR